MGSRAQGLEGFGLKVNGVLGFQGVSVSLYISVSLPRHGSTNQIAQHVKSLKPLRHMPLTDGFSSVYNTWPITT